MSSATVQIEFGYVIPLKYYAELEPTTSSSMFFELFLNYFSEKIKLDISCESSAAAESSGLIWAFVVRIFHMFSFPHDAAQYVFRAGATSVWLESTHLANSVTVSSCSTVSKSFDYVVKLADVKVNLALH